MTDSIKSFDKPKPWSRSCSTPAPIGDMQKPCSRARHLTLMLMAMSLAVASAHAFAQKGPKSPPSKSQSTDKELVLEGEIYSKVSSPVMPPTVPDMWQYVITKLAPEGMPVKKGQVVLSFDGGELIKRIAEKKATLEEKQRNRERLQLEQAEKARLETLSVEERRAARDKAATKASQPVHLLPSNEYKKLAVEKQQSERQYQLALQRERAAREQRKQEWLENEAALQLAQSELKAATAGMAAMDVKAPRDGVMVHKTSWNGEKFDVGSQVWMGLAVAEIPDPSTLAVRATVDERDFRLLQVGMNASIQLDGGNAIPGVIESLGRTVHSKSRQQPIPVVDVMIAIKPHREKIKPGQVVRVRVAKPNTIIALGKSR